MLYTPVLRARSALVLLLTGGALLAAPVLAEEEAQAQERIEQAEAEPAEAAQEGAQQGQDETDEGAAAITDDDDDDAAEAGETGTEPDHAGHAEPGVEAEEDEHADNPAVQAYRDIAERMHRDMQTEYDGDADVDFARGMIAHHQGAIDMAHVVLEHGEDAAIRGLAREVIEAQEEEIAFLHDWLAEQGHTVE